MDDQSRNATLRDLNEMRVELRAEMGELKQELRAEMGELKQELRLEMVHLADRLTETLRDMQTEFLRAAFVPTQQSDIKFRHLRADMGNADTAAEKRLAIVEERLREIELRLLIKPPEAA